MVMLVNNQYCVVVVVVVVVEHKIRMVVADMNPIICVHPVLLLDSLSS
jgi:hypothetical protein